MAERKAEWRRPRPGKGQAHAPHGQSEGALFPAYGSAPVGPHGALLFRACPVPAGRTRHFNLGGLAEAAERLGVGLLSLIIEPGEATLGEPWPDGFVSPFVRGLTDALAAGHLAHVHLAGQVPAWLDAAADDRLRAMLAEPCRPQAGPGIRLCFAYDQRQAIVETVQGAALAAARGDQPCAEERGRGRQARVPDLDTALSAALGPDIDYLIVFDSRSARFPSAVVWSAAYAEFAWLDRAWYGFSPDEFERVVASLRGRERRFGGLGTSAEPPHP